MYKFDCPHCQQKISSEEDYSGIEVQCPTCRADFVVPSTNGMTEIEAATTQAIATETSSNPEPDSSHTFADHLKDGKRADQKGGKSGRQTLAVAAAIGILAITAFGLFRKIGNNEKLVFNSRDAQAIESSGNSIDTSNSSVAQSNGTYRPNSGDGTAIGRFNETYAVTNTIGTRNGLNDMEILRAAFEATDWSGASSDLEDAVKSFMSVRSGESPASRSKKMEKFSVIMDAY